jgi:hypothetical protein
MSHELLTLVAGGTETTPTPTATRASCTHCGVVSPKVQGVGRAELDDERRLCPECRPVVCWDCGKTGDDVLRRSVPGRGWDPVLCRVCCSTYPGREWMARPEPGGNAS